MKQRTTKFSLDTTQSLLTYFLKFPCLKENQSFLTLFYLSLPKIIPQIIKTEIKVINSMAELSLRLFITKKNIEKNRK